jgi:PadR family transcriptional regulator PadR
MKGRREPAPELLGSFEEQVMLAVIRTGDQSYGMSVRRELERITRRDVTVGSVYTTLDRLEAKGLVTSTRVAGTDAISRRMFGITAAGVRALADTRRVRERLWTGVVLNHSKV